jgi:probable rRNA maturation factor
MIEPTYTMDEIEDPPSLWFKIVQDNFNKIIKNSLFDIYSQKTQLSIVFVNDQIMKEINYQFRGKNSTTDVLTFPLNEKLNDTYLLGEIIISIDKAKKDAQLFGITLFREIMILLIHGITHLLGFDHETDQQEDSMKSIENLLINQISLAEGAVLYE